MPVAVAAVVVAVSSIQLSLLPHTPVTTLLWSIAYIPSLHRMQVSVVCCRLVAVAVEVEVRLCILSTEHNKLYNTSYQQILRRHTSNALYQFTLYDYQVVMVQEVVSPWTHWSQMWVYCVAIWPPSDAPYFLPTFLPPRPFPVVAVVVDHSGGMWRPRKKDRCRFPMVLIRTHGLRAPSHTCSINFAPHISSLFPLISALSHPSLPPPRSDECLIEWSLRCDLDGHDHPHHSILGPFCCKQQQHDRTR